MRKSGSYLEVITNRLDMSKPMASVEAWVRDLFVSGPPHWMVPNKSMRSLSVNFERETERRKAHQDVKTIAAEEERRTEMPKRQRSPFMLGGPEVTARWLLWSSRRGSQPRLYPA